MTREVIVIEDSDSESESTTVSPSPNDGWPRKKRQLIEPFSDEEDKQGKKVFLVTTNIKETFYIY